MKIGIILLLFLGAGFECFAVKLVDRVLINGIISHGVTGDTAAPAYIPNNFTVYYTTTDETLTDHCSGGVIFKNERNDLNEMHRIFDVVLSAFINQQYVKINTTATGWDACTKAELIVVYSNIEDDT